MPPRVLRQKGLHPVALQLRLRRHQFLRQRMVACRQHVVGVPQFRLDKLQLMIDQREEVGGVQKMKGGRQHASSVIRRQPQGE